MAKLSPMINVERQGDTLILSLNADLREGKVWEIEVEAPPILDQFEDQMTKNVVVDFAETMAIGSSALGFFLRLWRRVKSRGGVMVLCNLSGPELEVLEVTKLDQLWPSYPTRAKALLAIQELSQNEG